MTTTTRLGANLPVAVQPDGSPIISHIRVEYPADSPGGPTGISDDMVTGYSLALKGTDRFVSYETADTRTVNSTLTVRDSIDGVRRLVASDRWAFGSCPSGQSSHAPTTRDICIFDGLKRDHIYELIYPAKNPWVMGIGLSLIHI